jgi:hypothetical protein
MTDPHTSMSLAAILILTVVVLVSVAGWLVAVFLAARQPGGGSAGPGSEGSARARRPDAVTHGGDVPARARAHPPARQPAGGGTDEALAPGTGQAG